MSTGLVTERPPQRAAPSRALVAVTALCAVSLVGIVVGLVMDDATITGAPAWLKPAKFAVSIAVYCATLAWMLRLVDGRRRWVAVLGWVTALSLAGELVLISLQVARGTTSHFNDDTPFDAAVFSAMGGLISLVFLAAVGAAVLLFCQRDLPASLRTGIRGGLLVSLLGMGEAGVMLANRAGGTAGAHTVGGPDGGPGLPITGWSTEFGDLRVAHFVGLHALQLLPLAAWFIRRTWPRLAAEVVSRLVVVLTGGLAGLVVGLTWQALREQPLLAPDALTVGVAVGWLLLIAAAAARALRADRVPA